MRLKIVHRGVDPPKRGVSRWVVLAEIDGKEVEIAQSPGQYRGTGGGSPYHQSIQRFVRALQPNIDVEIP